jgi:DNA-binding NarL/FixJ family response regulator
LSSRTLIRVAIVDDHPVFREGLRRVLDKVPDLAIVWESGTASDLVERLATEPVDVLLIDLYLGENEDSLAAARAARERFSDLRVIVISASLDWDAATASRQAGASGFLPKDLSVDDMVAGIRALADPNLGRPAFSDRSYGASPKGSRWITQTGLTRREREVLFEIVRGASNREIAARLGVSVTTVNKHVHHVLSKLKAKNRAQVVARVRAWPGGRSYENALGRS